MFFLKPFLFLSQLISIFLVIFCNSRPLVLAISFCQHFFNLLYLSRFPFSFSFFLMLLYLFFFHASCPFASFLGFRTVFPCFLLVISSFSTLTTFVLLHLFFRHFYFIISYFFLRNFSFLLVCFHFSSKFC